MIIGIAGFRGCGKDTTAKILLDRYNFEKDSLASSLKDACSSIFGWDRIMLDGLTEEDRELRTVIDEWWAEKLNISNFSPVYALQNIGTELFRKQFNDDIWTLSVEYRIKNHENKKVVISDLRFPNEIDMLRKYDATIIRVKRGDDPEWFDDVAYYNLNPHLPFPQEYKFIHESERAWIGQEFDYIINNDGTIEDIECEVKKIMEQI